MSTSSKVFGPAAAALALGGLCWVVKFVVIAATDGAVSGMPDTATSVLWITAVSLMVAGMVGLGFALTHRRHLALRIVAACSGVVAWVLSYAVIETIAQSVVGETDPAWLGDEIGIISTGAVLMTLGLLLLRRALDDRPRHVVTQLSQPQHR